MKLYVHVCSYCVCVCVFVRVLIVHLCICTVIRVSQSLCNSCIRNLFCRKNKSNLWYVDSCVYLCMHVSVSWQICSSICLSVHVSACMYHSVLCVFVFVYMRVHVCACVCTHDYHIQ